MVDLVEYEGIFLLVDEFEGQAPKSRILEWARAFKIEESILIASLHCLLTYADVFISDLLIHHFSGHELTK